MRKQFVTGLVFILIFLGSWVMFSFLDNPVTQSSKDWPITVDSTSYVEFKDTKDLLVNFVSLDKFNILAKDDQGNTKTYLPQYKDGSYLVQAYVSEGEKYFTDRNTVRCAIPSTESILYTRTQDEESLKQLRIIQWTMSFLIIILGCLVYFLFPNYRIRSK